MNRSTPSPRTCHTLPRILALAGFVVIHGGCISLNYPTSGGAEAAGSEEAAERAARESTSPPAAPVLLGMGFGDPEEDLGALGLESEAAAGWAELTRRARLARQSGDFDEARTYLEQAATQLESQSAATTQRRTVAGMRARLALDYVALKQDDKADELADAVLAEVRSSPEIGGPAIVELAYFFANRREIASEKAGNPESQLELFRVALLSAEQMNASQSRLNLAFEISEAATRDDDHDLARRAVDLAVRDAQKIAPTDRDQLASLKIFKTRVALAQGDYLTAVASATAANRIFAEIEAPPANLAVAEATLSRALSSKGDRERALAIAEGAKARILDKKSVPPYARRIVVAELARGESAAGDVEAARQLFETALAIPPVDFEGDRLLRQDLEEERAALGRPVEDPDPASAPEQATSEAFP